MSSSSSRRKMLAAREDIANRVVELAKRKDMTVYQTVNDILEQALRVEEHGISLRQVVDERWMLEKAQETGFTFTIEQLFYRTVDDAFSSDPERFAGIWREMGHWYGKYFQAKHDDPLDGFREALELFTVGGCEYSLEIRGRNLVFCFIGERLSPGYVELFSVFVEALLAVLGYELRGREVGRGIIRLELSR